MCLTRFFVILISLATIAVTPAFAQIKVGSKNFTEQFVLAELYAQALEANGIKVERKINLGGTLIAHKALEEKQIDLYPEYTGTMLLAVIKGVSLLLFGRILLPSHLHFFLCPISFLKQQYLSFAVLWSILSHRD